LRLSTKNYKFQDYVIHSWKTPGVITHLPRWSISMLLLCLNFRVYMSW